MHVQQNLNNTFLGAAGFTGSGPLLRRHAPLLKQCGEFIDQESSMNAKMKIGKDGEVHVKKGGPEGMKVPDCLGL